MVDSQLLLLAQASQRLQEAVAGYLSEQLSLLGYSDISPVLLGFLGQLDCGINHASDIARQMRVSRQMVAKYVRELCQLGYLRQEQGHGKQKNILFTARGEQLMAQARQLLATADSQLLQNSDASQLAQMAQQLTNLAEEFAR